MPNYFATLVAVLTLMGCEGSATKTKAKSIDQEWITLVATDGCLVGSQDAIAGLREGTCLREPAWADFLRDASREKIDFLIGRMASLENTSIHNCGAGNASEGELAVIVLQHLTHKLWADYSGYDHQLVNVISEYNIAMNRGDYIFDQIIIRDILSEDSMRESLADYFKEQEKKDNKAEMATPRKLSD